MVGRKLDMDGLLLRESEQQFPLCNGSVFDQVFDERAYTLAKEHWVSDLEGSSAWMIISVTSVFPLCVFAFNAIRHGWLGQSGSSRNRWKGRRRRVFDYLVEWVLVAMPSILAFCPIGSTLISEDYISSVLCIIALMLVVGSTRWFRRSRGPLISLNGLPVGCDLPRKPYVSLFRASLMLQTMLAILSVDFCVFPRSFAKTETFGLSVMDLGVGAFVFTYGLIARGGRLSNDDESSSLLLSLLDSMKKVIRRVMPLLVAGVMRYLSTRAVDYHNHRSEYGAHWNFFFTMSLITVIHSLIVETLLSWLMIRCSIMTQLSNYQPGLILTMIVLCVYQFALVKQRHSSFDDHHYYDHPHSHSVYHYDNLTEYIFADMNQRNLHHFIDANREGLFSCIGFLSLYSLGYHLSPLLMKDMRIKSDMMIRLLLLLSVSLLMILPLSCVSHYWIQPISRRLCNLSYVLSTLCFAMMHLCLCMLPSLLLAHSTVHGSFIVHCLDSNMFAAFLIANVLTGIINLRLRTLLATPEVGLLVISGYLACCLLILEFLRVFNIKLKF